MTLTEFLLARYAEDEAVARAATPGPWTWEEPSTEKWPSGDQSLVTAWSESDGSPKPVLYGWGYDASGIDAEDADRVHIARHDPARVLAECEAKRRIVSLFAPTLADDKRAALGEWDETAWRGEQALRALAQPYADHPDFQEEWRP